MKTIKEILTTMSEAAYRPADNTDVGQIAPVSLQPQDFQAAPPAPVAPYPANETGNVVAGDGGLDEKEFINDPALPASSGNDITSVDDIQDRINGVVSEDAINTILDQVIGKLMAESIYEVQLKSELGSMFESQGLNEDFTSKATDIFESAVTAAGKKHLLAISEAAETYISQELNAYQQAQQASINEYLTHTVNEWAEENRLALELGARTRIAESFMEGLKGLLESHYVELPKDKVDLYEAAIKKGDEILDQLDEEKAKSAALAEEVTAFKKSTILESALKNVSSVKAEKIRSLMEAITFTDADSFRARVDVAVSSLSQQTPIAKPLTEDTVVVPATPVTESVSEIEAIAKKISRINGR